MATPTSDSRQIDRTRPDRAHLAALGDLLESLDTGEDGLTRVDAERCLSEVGPNQLPTPGRSHWVVRFLGHFRDVLILVLLAAAALTALMRHWLDTGVILAVVIINATVGFVQEGRAEKAIDGIRRMLSASASVRRDGVWVTVEADTVVPGDVARLRAGDRVPADMRLIEANGLQIDESALTGESTPSAKRPGTCEQDEVPIGDRFNMAYSGTLVARGHGVGVVTATGQSTEIGHINAMVSEVEAIATPLTRQMAAFGKVLSIAIVAMAGVIVAMGALLHGGDLGELAVAAISFAVAAIPEGLPAILTITLAIGVQRMARRNAITRRLNAVETLGSVTVICSDKTGTLTRNEMTVRELIAESGARQVSGLGYGPDGEVDGLHGRADGEVPADVGRLIEIMATCNDSTLVEEDGEWSVHGDPTEGALLALAAKAGFDRTGHRRVAVVPFESDNKLMASIEVAPGGDRLVMVKGAPERLLDRCDRQYRGDGKPEPIDRDTWEERAASLARDGMRVLAAASRPDQRATDELDLADLDEGLVFAGVVGIVDPPRPEAVEAIEVCRGAGITVKMITGDHSATAGAIAREMGLTSSESVISGPQLESASEDELDQLVLAHDVFARASPEHKLRLVTALQRCGEVVAMTGDGVNDAPALARADVGVAMGLKGTEATKEAAEIVLADDNFASIERAVEEGRTIYDNLRKSIIFILPTNGAEAMVMLVAVLFGLALPLSPVQILWVNMVTAVTLALALAFEAGEPGLMQRPPRAPGGSLIDGAFVRRLVLVSVLMGGATVGLFLATEATGRSVEFARTVAVNTLVVAEVCYLFNSRYLRAPSWTRSALRGSPAVWVAVGALAVLQLAFVYAPFMNALFESEPLPLLGWAIPALVGITVFVAVEIEKALVRASERRRGATPPSSPTDQDREPVGNVESTRAFKR